MKQDARIVPLKGFNGYHIDENGIVYSEIARGCRDKTDKSKYTELHEVNPRPLPNGYLRVYLRCPDGKRRDFYLHRLTAQTFLPNPENKPCVNHLDCDRENNCTDNLVWCTVKENTAYSESSGMMKRDSKGRFHHKFR